jgi:hypothetical protein
MNAHAGLHARMVTAVIDQDHREIYAIHATEPSAVNMVVGGVSPMLVASQRGMADTMDLLHSLGSDAGLRVDSDGMTPLFALLTRCPQLRRPPCLQLMLGWDDVDIDAEWDLQSAVEYLGGLNGEWGDLASLQTLVMHGASICEGSVTNRTTRAALLTWAGRELASAHPQHVMVRLERCRVVLEREEECESRWCGAKPRACALA